MPLVGIIIILQNRRNLLVLVCNYTFGKKNGHKNLQKLYFDFCLILHHLREYLKSEHFC